MEDAIDVDLIDTDEEEAFVPRRLRSDDKRIFRRGTSTSTSFASPTSTPAGIQCAVTASTDYGDDDSTKSRFSQDESTDTSSPTKKRVLKYTKKPKNQKKPKQPKANTPSGEKNSMLMPFVASSVKTIGTPIVREEHTDACYASEMFGSRILIDKKNCTPNQQKSSIQSVVEINGVVYELFHSKFVSKKGKGFDEDSSE